MILLSLVNPHSGFTNIPEYYCLDDSAKLTEGVTSSPEIFGNKRGATSTPEIFGKKQSFVLTFFATNTIYVNVNIANLNEIIEIKELSCTKKPGRG